MGFGDHYINVFNVLKNIGLLSEKPVKTAEGVEVVPLKVLKAVLPDPASLAKNYTGYTCIGNLIKGKKNGQEKEIFIYNVCDHAACYKEVESQAISYTAGVPRRRRDPGGPGHLEPQDHGQRGRTGSGSVPRLAG